MDALMKWSPFGPAMAPVSTKWQLCYDIASLLESSSGRLLIENFQRSVDNIFAINDFVNGPQYYEVWNLLTVTPICPNEYQAYFDLLNVSGPVFRAISRIMSSEPCLRLQIQAGAIEQTPMGLNRFQKDTQPIHIFELNPLEYYFFRFAEHLLNAACSYPHVDSDNVDCVYIALLKDYLASFLPPDGVFRSFLGSSDSISTTAGHRSDRYLLEDSYYHVRGTPMGLLRRELFRSSVTASTFSPTQAQNTRYSDMLWKSSTLLSVILDCWFNAPESRLHAASQSVGAPVARKLPVCAAARANAAASSIVAVINRIVVHHLHHFAYGPSSGIMDAQFRDFKERYVPRLVDCRMWAYLQYAFETWPLDFSFRLLLELWFAYILPWRCAHGGYEQGQSGERNYDAHWEIFVKEHDLFYSRFLQAALERLSRMDLAAYRNAVMLYRVAYVFSDPELHAALGWGPIEQVSGAFMATHGAAFGLGSMVIAVARRAHRALKFCENAVAEEKQNLSRQSWLAWMTNMLLVENGEASHAVELDRCRQCLDMALATLQNSFGFHLPHDVGPDYSADDTLSTASTFRAAKEPDSVQDDDGRLCLTPLGRRQLLNAHRQFDFSRIKWPSDLMPFNYSNEIGFLAEYLQRLSSRISAIHGKNLEILYRQPRGVVPWVLRKCLEPPTRLVRRNSPVVERRPSELKARVNLRPLASYRFLLRFCFVWFCGGLIAGFPTVTLLFIAALLFFILWIYLVLKYHPAVRGV